MIAVIAAGILVAAAIIGAVTFLGKGGAETHTIRGTLSAPECGGGYDIAGASVEVKNQADHTIASGTTSFDNNSGGNCEVSFKLADVPKANFYKFTIGSHGGPSYSFREMESNNWRLDLSLG